MRPNYPTGGDLNPAVLNPYLVEATAELALQLTMNGLHAPYRTEDFKEYTVPAYPFKGGELEPVSTGDAKYCYRLQTTLGTMAVQVLSHDESFGLLMPSSQYLTQVRQSPVLRLWEYADTRSYIVLPYSDSIGVRFQEDGGKNYGGTSSPYKQVSMRATRQRAKRRVKNELTIDPRDWQYFDGEAAHDRHYLKKRDHFLPLMIDVPIEERGWRSNG